MSEVEQMRNPDGWKKVWTIIVEISTVGSFVLGVWQLIQTLLSRGN